MAVPTVEPPVRVSLPKHLFYVEPVTHIVTGLYDTVAANYHLKSMYITCFQWCTEDATSPERNGLYKN